MTWGALAGLAWAGWQLCRALLCWRDLRGKERRVRKRLKNGGAAVVSNSVPDVRHRRFPRPPLPCRRPLRRPRVPAGPPPRELARAHWWSRGLRAPVLCARRKGCGQPCLYPDHVYGGGRRWR